MELFNLSDYAMAGFVITFDLVSLLIVYLTERIEN